MVVVRGRWDWREKVWEVSGVLYVVGGQGKSVRDLRPGFLKQCWSGSVSKFACSSAL